MRYLENGLFDFHEILYTGLFYTRIELIKFWAKSAEPFGRNGRETAVFGPSG